MTKKRVSPILDSFTETFGLPRWVLVVGLVLLSVAIACAVFWFFDTAPPDTIVMTTGSDFSAFQTTALKYSNILARSHVLLKTVPSQGSIENLKRLSDPSSKIDVGFVQGGVTNGVNSEKVISLGSVSYAPLLIFYRSETNLNVLSEFAGKRLAVGAEGSGTRSLALTLLALNGIETNGPTTLLNIDADEAAKALTNGSVDAVFLMGDSASPQIMRSLLRAPEIKLFNFCQADGYIRRIGYLNKMVLPMGSIDFGKNLPPHDTQLIGPTVELLAKPGLHPALSDLLLEAAQEIHGNSSLFQHHAEFPAPLEHEFHISPDATSFYKSGKSFLYRTLPSFWLASLVNRLLVVFIPTIVVVIPGLRMIPVLYRWRVKLRLYRRYRALLVLEQNLFIELTPERRQELIRRLDEIEASVNKMRVPASFADQFYGLRGSINFVRSRLTTPVPVPVPAPLA